MHSVNPHIARNPHDDRFCTNDQLVWSRIAPPQRALNIWLIMLVFAQWNLTAFSLSSRFSFHTSWRRMEMVDGGVHVTKTIYTFTHEQKCRLLCCGWFPWISVCCSRPNTSHEILRLLVYSLFVLLSVIWTIHSICLAYEQYLKKCRLRCHNSPLNGLKSKHTARDSSSLHI